MTVFWAVGSRGLNDMRWIIILTVFFNQIVKEKVVGKHESLVEDVKSTLSSTAADSKPQGWWQQVLAPLISSEFLLYYSFCLVSGIKSQAFDKRM